MHVWKLLLGLTFLLLGGCLVVFREPLPANEPAPLALLGEWSRSNEWGEQLFLDIASLGENRYRARITVGSPDNLEGAEEYAFSVSQQNRRWYLSLALPKRFGDNYAIGGFEINRDNELLLYSLDIERFLQEVAAGRLQGEVIETAYGDSALISSPPAQVFAFLNDPANSDIFVEVARYQRSSQ